MPDINLTQVLISFLVLVLSLSVHEAAHAWSADRLGDSTARRLGRVSFNPAVHVDPIGTILFPLLAVFTGLPLIGWAKPVPVNVANLRGNWKQKYMVIAAAGPASNLVLASIGATLVHVVGYTGYFGARLLPFFVTINVLLAVFNLLPVPPLDGGNVLSGLLRGAASDFFDRLRPYGFLILYGLLLTGVLFSIVEPVSARIVSWLLY